MTITMISRGHSGSLKDVQTPRTALTDQQSSATTRMCHCSHAVITLWELLFSYGLV